MSLVLEALKRQEAAGNPDAAVSLARQASLRRRHRLWASLFAVAMVTNVGVLFWAFGLPWLQQRQMQESAADVPKVAQEAPAPGEAPTPGTIASQSPASEATPGQAPASPSRQASSAQPASPARPADSGRTLPETAAADRDPARAPGTATESSSPPPPPEPETKRISLESLSTAARRRFPGIAFSSHIYAEDADLRAIVANGQHLQEGDRVRGLEIVEITENGVVLAFEGNEVEVPLVTDWDT